MGADVMIINLSQGADPSENVAEFYAHVMRGARDTLLAASDWTQTLDAVSYTHLTLPTTPYV